MKATTIKKITTKTTIGIVAALITLTGCSENNPVESPTSSGYDENADVAESVAGTVGEDTGGLMDQVNDMVSLAGEESLSKSNGDFFNSKEKNWDESTKTWTIVLERERGYESSSFYALIEREYQLQFLNKSGEAQQFWITNGDTANTMSFKIINGNGRHKTLKLSQELLELEGNFTATGVNTDTVTINGTYARAAVDTITTEKMTRTHNHAIQLSITDLKGPRKSRNDLTKKYSGLITGTYNAEIHFEGEKGEADRTVEKEIYIDIANGDAEIIINKQKYKSSKMSGKID